MKKMSTLAWLGGACLFAAACATSPPRVYGPGTQMPTSTVNVDGQIAECGHAGASPAIVTYPDGWQQRLSEVATKSMAQDELLGGPVVTEVGARNDQPSSPPIPTYPSAAAASGIEGKCYAMMDVTPAGQTDDILVACSSPAFVGATRDAVSTVTFAPKMVEGRAVRRLNVIYPIEYCLR